MNASIQLVDINYVRVGDIVVHGGRLLTVGKADLKPDTFMGTTLFGDSYRCGTIPVKRVCVGGRK